MSWVVRYTQWVSILLVLYTSAWIVWQYPGNPSAKYSLFPVVCFAVGLQKWMVLFTTWDHARIEMFTVLEFREKGLWHYVMRSSVKECVNEKHFSFWQGFYHQLGNPLTHTMLFILWLWFSISLYYLLFFTWFSYCAADVKWIRHFPISKHRRMADNGQWFPCCSNVNGWCRKLSCMLWAVVLMSSLL